MNRRKILEEYLSGRCKLPEHFRDRDTLQIKLLRVPIHSGTILSMNLPRLPNGTHCVSSRDVPVQSTILLDESSFPLFAEKNIRWLGEVILAVGGNQDEGVQWLSNVEIQYSEEQTSPLENVEIRQEKGTPKEKFKTAFQIVEAHISVPPLPSPKPGAGILCRKESSAYKIYMETSWPSLVRFNAARVLQMNEEQIEVIPCPLRTGTEPVLWEPVADACRAALLSAKAGKSAYLSPSEMQNACFERPGADFHTRAAVDSRGEIIAMDAKIILSVGEAFPYREEFLNRITLGLLSVYPCRDFSFQFNILQRKAPPSALGPTGGFQLGFLAGEQLYSRIAELSLSPHDKWRLQFVLGSKGNKKRVFGSGIEHQKNCSAEELLMQASKQTDFERKNASYEQIRINRNQLTRIPDFFQGIGISAGWFGNGFMTDKKELSRASVLMKMDSEDSLKAAFPASNPMSPLSEVWNKIAEDTLNLKADNISLQPGFSDWIVDSGPSVWGRNVSVYTELFKSACRDISRQTSEKEFPLSLEKTTRKNHLSSWNSSQFEGCPFETISWGACVVEVGMSPHNYTILSARISLFIDGGTILNETAALCAVESSAEEVFLQVMGDNPSCSEAQENVFPAIDVYFHNSESDETAKDVATLPLILVPSALIDALQQASGGITVEKLPVLPADFRKKAAEKKKEAPDDH